MTRQGRAVTVRSMRTTAPAIAARALRERAGRHYVLDGRTAVAPPLRAGLYLVATPIGNLGDITVRALEVLAAVDLIACEDTRVTRKLLDRYGIATPLTSYHEHNAAQARPKLLARLADGAAIALVSDAGTPLVSDPGYKLVREARAAGANVTALPGASAVLAALTVSGLPTDRFLFEGFLPAKEAARRARIAELERIPATLVLFETGARIAASLADLAAGLGPREAALCRELTKFYEEIRRGDLATLAHQAADAPEPRGELVIVVAPPDRQDDVSAADLDALLRQALDRLSVKDAVAEIAAVSGAPRREVYRRAIALSKERGHAR
jgi:16S rRNA (cytidine1402-2'-O)-methyltransferase